MASDFKLVNRTLTGGMGAVRSINDRLRKKGSGIVKKIVCCGFSSDFMIETNIKKILQEMQVEAQVDHVDLVLATSEKADIYVGTRDLAGQLLCLGGRVISLNNMTDMTELREKLAVVLGIPASKA
jgi:PTS system ascorbate-specific IIB component